MPGVVVTTGVRSGPATGLDGPAATFFAVGTAERGPVAWNNGSATAVAPQLVTSMADFSTYFGGYNASYSLWQHAKTFFEEGGSRMYVNRVVGATSTGGTLALSTSGSAALTLTAANPGAWSTGLSAMSETSNSQSQVKVYYNGSLVYATGWASTVGDLVSKINGNSTAKIYVTAVANQPTVLLAANAASAFSAGTNGSAPTTADYTGALARFDQSFGAGAVAIPGQTGASVWAALISHAKTYNRIALLAGAAGDSTSTAISNMTSYSLTSGAENTGYYYPHVTMLNDAGATLTISPESYVAAKRSLAHVKVGPWQAGAGVISQSSFITGTNIAVNRTDGDTLDAGRINALRVINGAVRIYGARSISSDEDNYRYITYRDTLNYVVTEAEQSLEDLVFSPLDGRNGVFGLIEARLVALLEPMRTAGGLYEAFTSDGEQIDPGYSVVVDSTLNPVTQLAQGIVKARVGIRVSGVGDQLQVEVLKSNLSNPVV